MRFWPWSKPKSVKTAAPVMIVRGKYDAAQTTVDNRRHWAAADGLSPNAAVNPEVRRTLRNRARYEVANNSYAKGIVLTLANDTIGTGPRLQMLTQDADANRRIEEAFSDWARAVDLAAKLRTARMARAESGEAFALLTSSPTLDTPVKLDVRLVEPEQVCTPWTRSARPDGVDGIVFDAAGHPVAYHVLRRHPGDGAFGSVGVGRAFGGDGYDTLPASAVLHYYRADRPGQWRGIPDITPALPLFAQLRRYTLAVLTAAESAANIAIVMKTNIPAGGEAAEVEPMTEMEMVPNTALFSPEGWEPSQIKAEHPSTTYGEFKREVLNEIARCLNMPFNVAAGNSSGYNYASGRLDHQTYFKSLRVEQRHLEVTVLDRVLRAWLAEAVLVEGLLRRGTRTREFARQRAIPHGWFWDGVEHVDPAKEAGAQATRLASHTTTLAHEYARQGRDWESELRQRAKELALMSELGLTQATPEVPPEATPEASDDTPDPDEGEARKEAA